MKTMPARAAITEHFEANEADILARVIAGNVTMIDEAIDAPALTRLFGSATPFARYRIEFTSPAPVNDSPRSDTGNEGIFHRVSEAVTEVEAPHFQHRPAKALSGDDRLAAPSGVV